MSHHYCSQCEYALPGHHPWCDRSEDLEDIGLNEAQEIIRILVEDKSKSVEKHVYTGERISTWWKKWGKGQLDLLVGKDYPRD